MNWLAELYSTDKRRMLAIAYAIVLDHAIAEDVVHSAMVRLTQIEFIPDVPRLYAFRVVRNLALDHLRELRHALTNSNFGIENTTDPSFRNEANNRCSDEILVEKIGQLLKELSPLYSEVIDLHLRVGLTFREISNITDTPIATLASRYRRGIECIKKQLMVQHERS